MSAPKFRVRHIDFDTMVITDLGVVAGEKILHHPEGWVIVVLEDGTYMRTDHNPKWEKISGAKEKELTIRTAADDEA